MPVTYLILPGYCTDLSPSFYLISVNGTTIYIVAQSPNPGSIFDFWSLRFYCHHYHSVQYIVKSYLFYLQNNIKSIYFINISATILIQMSISFIKKLTQGQSQKATLFSHRTCPKFRQWPTEPDHEPNNISVKFNSKIFAPGTRKRSLQFSHIKNKQSVLRLVLTRIKEFRLHLISLRLLGFAFQNAMVLQAFRALNSEAIRGDKVKVSASFILHAIYAQVKLP